MKSVFLTGSTGFVGTYIQTHFVNKFLFTKYQKDSIINISQDIVLHFAGKAHDLKQCVNVQEYYTVNTELTKNIFDNFLNSNAEVFITLSSVKAAADELDSELTEDHIPNPVSHYGKSKLIAEQYILNKKIPDGKRVYILRPCLIYGPGNKGNLNLLHKIVSTGLPWPLGSFENKRSFCSIDNLCFTINELIENNKIPSGIYNIADNDAISTNELIQLIAKAHKKKLLIFKIPKSIITIISKLGDILNLPLNSENLQKLTETYKVSNKKILLAMGKELPVSSKAGLIKTIESFTH